VPVAILMYHAIPAAVGQRGPWDPHYAVAVPRFREQLARLAADGYDCVSVRSLLESRSAERDAAPRRRAVALTFDDGTATDREFALQALLDARASADFFVNTARIGAPGVVDWTGLRELAAAGMSIQSHGHTHRMLDELDEAALREELDRSRKTLEDRLGTPVELFAPAGGRLPPRAVALARAAGYRAICSSRPGAWRGPAEFVAPRMAVLASTPTGRIADWAARRPGAMLRERSRHAAAGLAKRTLGNVGYERLRARLLGQAAPR
jgi:peptidoglycan/xylan/chitin deacetylase (PgdA/CDA1 family)